MICNLYIILLNCIFLILDTGMVTKRQKLSSGGFLEFYG